ncbi:MAG: CCA tRNA nucleotidyltransferase [Planctomycetota bacterium]
MVRRPEPSQLDDSQRRVSAAIAERLRSGGHQAWLVGGCVRDLALGRPAKDVDVTTDARPEAVERLFRQTIGVGRAFGTVVVADFEHPVEVTTFRTERGYSDGRRPDEVAYSDTPEEDAQRRDFTCNALYLDPLTGELRDPTGGMADLERGVLRAVGDAEERFREDSLRLLRLVRFAATLDLSVDAGTYRAAKATSELLPRIARERVLHELVKMADEGDLARGARLLDELDLWGGAFGDAHELSQEHLRVLSELPRGPGAALGLAALLAYAGVGADVRTTALATLEGLKPPRELLRSVDGLLRGLELLLDGARLADLVRARERVRSTEWRTLVAAYVRAGECLDTTHLARLDAVLADWPDERSLPAPLLDANALVALGFERGPRLGETLRALVDAQVEGAVCTADDARAFALRRLADGS